MKLDKSEKKDHKNYFSIIKLLIILIIFSILSIISNIIMVTSCHYYVEINVDHDKRVGVNKKSFYYYNYENSTILKWNSNVKWGNLTKKQISLSEKTKENNCSAIQDDNIELMCHGEVDLISFIQVYFTMKIVLLIIIGLNMFLEILRAILYIQGFFKTKLWTVTFIISICLVSFNLIGYSILKIIFMNKWTEYLDKGGYVYNVFSHIDLTVDTDVSYVDSYYLSQSMILYNIILFVSYLLITIYGFIKIKRKFKQVEKENEDSWDKNETNNFYIRKNT